MDERRVKNENRLSMVSLEYLLILIGKVFLIAPNFIDEIVAFLEDSHLAEADSNVLLPVPKSSHPVIYTAATQFCVAYGLFQIVLLVLRFVYRDSLDKGGNSFWNSACME